jgi:hypothetical protein
MAETNTNEKIVYKLVKTNASVSSSYPDVFKIKIAEYDFSQNLSNLVLFDTDYALLVLNGRELGFIITKGMAKTMANEKFVDADIYGRISAQGLIIKVEGYSITLGSAGNQGLGPKYRMT